MALIYGRKTTTMQKTHFVVVRKTKDSIRRSGTDGKNDETYRESQLAMRRTSKGIDATIYFICGVECQ